MSGTTTRHPMARPPLRAQLFGTWRASALTLCVGGATLAVVAAALHWAVLAAVPPWGAPAACGDASGACWPFLVEKTPLILFGTYDYAERWRPALATALILGVAGLTLFGRLRAGPLACAWAAALPVFLVLMYGGVAGLPVVPPSRWNGIPVLVFLAAFGLALAFPLGLALALGRRSALPVVARLATAYIEFVRSVPMVAVLFFGVFVLPLVVPGGQVEPLYAALVALVLFHAAYVAEDLRGGLQTIGRGQYDSARALGLREWPMLRHVILPQAIRAAVPSLTNTAIGGFKDTSLVVIVGLHDLMATAKMAYNDPQWQGRAPEAYLLVGAIFFLVCWMIGLAGRRMERKLAVPA
ncbi:MAG: amino acid ABC transporter permease [Burkholderiales bacterium]